MRIGESNEGKGQLVRLADAETPTLDDGAKEVLEAAVGRVLDQIQGLASIVAAGCVREIPSFRLAPDVAPETEAAIAQHATEILQHLASGQDPADETLASLAELGTRRHPHGMSLAALQQAYGIGKNVVLTALIDELWTLCLDEDQRRKLILHATERSLALTGKVAAAFAHRYSGSQRKPGSLASGSLETLLSHEGAVHELRHGLERLGFSPADRHLVAVVGASYTSVGLREDMIATAESIRDRSGIPRHHVEVTSGGNELIVAFTLGASHAEMVAELETSLMEARETRGVDLVAGVGRAQQGLDGISVSHEQARMAFEVRLKLRGVSSVLTHAHAIPYALLEQRPGVSWELASLLTPLLTQPSQGMVNELLCCLRAYLAAGGRSARAAALAGVSRRTLERRLKQARELIGCDLDDGAVRLTLDLALRALQVRGRDSWASLPLPGPRARRRARIALVPDSDEGPPVTEVS